MGLEEILNEMEFTEENLRIFERLPLLQKASAAEVLIRNIIGNQRKIINYLKEREDAKSQ